MQIKENEANLIQLEQFQINATSMADPSTPPPVMDVYIYVSLVRSIVQCLGSKVIKFAASANFGIIALKTADKENVIMSSG